MTNAPIEWVVMAVPILAGLGVAYVGMMQVREFRARTGERGWLTSLLGMTFLPWVHEAPRRADCGKRPKRS